MNDFIRHEQNFLADPRSKDFFLMENPPISITIILVGYVLMIKYLPKVMESRKPFELKGILMVYNIFQVVSNLMLGVYVRLRLQIKRTLQLQQPKNTFQGIYHQFFAQRYNFACQPVNYSSNHQGMTELKLGYFYLLLKILDLLDTVSLSESYAMGNSLI